MDEKYAPLIVMISTMVGMSLGLLIFHKILKNPFRYIANTRKKKIISTVILLILWMGIASIFDSSNIYLKNVYKWTISGILISISNRIFITEKEDKKTHINKIE